MREYSNSKVIYDLVDSIVIFDSENNVTFNGSKISEVLLHAGIDLAFFSGNRNDLGKNHEDLIKIVEEVRENMQPQTTTLVNTDKSFVVFPANFNGSFDVIFGLREEVVQINRMEHDLEERVKELRCLYKITRELESGKTLEEVYEQIVMIIKEGFQFPAYSRVSLTVGKNTFGFKELLSDEKFHFLSSDIYLGKIKRGELRIYLDKGYSFLDEEKHLIEEVAGKISRAIEKHRKTINLEKQKKILTIKNESLLRLTEVCNSRRERLRTFFSAITDPIIVIDQEFNITMSNKNDIGDSGKCYEKLFSRLSKCENCPASLTFEDGKNAVHEFEDDGFNYILRSYPIVDKKGRVDGVLEVCRDITKQKKMEDQLIQASKLTSLGKLVAGVAHEINNPNTFILGNLKIVEESFHDIFPILDEYYSKNPDLKIARLNYDIFKDNIEVLVKDMINGANRTKKIVGDLRNFAKKDEGLLTENVDLNDIISNHLTITRKHVKKQGNFEIYLEDNLPTFKGSCQKMEQVLINLILNATEAIQNGDGVISIHTKFNKEKNMVCLIITDNGCGMDDQTRRNIFDPFYTTKRDKGGTGLGLSITYGIIEDHKGIIEVDSQLGEGTTFKISIPANGT
ncbi:MAG: GHKL domain-containing protein [Bacteroidetes bacterium]|nr:GHKL domain-containing protein [Bacteroidota bacterium]